VFGPAEAYGIHDLSGAFRLLMVAHQAGAVTSAPVLSAIAGYGFADCPQLDIILVPGGIGTRREVENQALVSWLRARADAAERVTSVCTGRGDPGPRRIARRPRWIG
jgi:putative intracellular protease/amidase